MAIDFLPLFDCPGEKMFVTVDSLTAHQLFHQTEDVELLGPTRELELELGLPKFDVRFAAPLLFPEAQSD